MTGILAATACLIIAVVGPGLITSMMMPLTCSAISVWISLSCVVSLSLPSRTIALAPLLAATCFTPLAMPTGKGALRPSLARPIVMCLAAVLDDGVVAPVDAVLHAVRTSVTAAGPAMGSHDSLRRHAEWSFI